ncbi:hypothetical protein A2594_00805 [Candidatus Woesebacteria bacterium RIFOXYD1_FULL_41_28]|uniref:Uncharacterized protein n=1 Tax=Candidatus Woesebacteria bacterium RIFOXYD1_FULL_41_28 TaxID=1802550 RepID=A0A1F8DK70_9BACT|nr:MAG: hypothetical protein A2594_00805 [Candidatus Woesebacteria bacterium RIFOXYD1_FULL_41_28]
MAETSEGPRVSIAPIPEGNTPHTPKVIITPESTQREIDEFRFAQQRLARRIEAKRRIDSLKRSQLSNSG